MDLEKYLSMPNAEISPLDEERLSRMGGISLTPFLEKDSILYDETLQTEMGYARFGNGNWLVSVPCSMEGVDETMIRWWFWWHPQEEVRYRMWYPGEHLGIGYAIKDRDYFSKESLPPFEANTQYPIERIGKRKMPLSIRFVDPEEFGFDREAMEKGNVALIVSGHVGAYHGLVGHTEMAHIFLKRKGGLFLLSASGSGKG